MILQHPTPPNHKFLHISAIVEIRASQSIKHSHCKVHLHCMYTRYSKVLNCIQKEHLDD